MQGVGSGRRTSMRRREDTVVAAAVVDTRPTARIGAMSVLEKQWPTWQVFSASSEEEFGRLAGEQHFDLVLTDLHLQRNLDGLDLCRFAKRSWEGTSTLVFVEDQDPDTILAAITSRVVDGIVQRTACVSSLVSAIASVLEGYQAWRFDAPTPGNALPNEPGPADLTRRERTILVLLCRWWSNREIAQELHLAEQTVKNNLSTIYGKLGVNGRTEFYASAKGQDLPIYHVSSEVISV